MKQTIMLIMLLTGSSVFAGDEGWLTNLKEAKEIAAADSRYILVNFTGSDWCGWCKRLDREVFAKDAFKNFAVENLVLVKLDFPRFKELPAEERKANDTWRRKYRIRGFPTILLLNEQGEVVMETGYRRGGPQSYVAHLKSKMNGV